MGDPVPQAHLLQRLDRPDATLRPSRPGVAQRQLHVAPRGQGGKQVELLEDEADPPVADLGESVLGHPGDVLASKAIVARGGYVEAAEDVHQGRLPRPGRAHDRYVLSLGDAQVDAAQRVDLDGAGPVGLANTVEFDDGWRAGRRLGEE